MAFTQSAQAKDQKEIIAKHWEDAIDQLNMCLFKLQKYYKSCRCIDYLIARIYLHNVTTYQRQE